MKALARCVGIDAALSLDGGLKIGERLVGMTNLSAETITLHSKRSEPRPSQFRPQAPGATASAATPRRQSFSSL